MMRTVIAVVLICVVNVVTGDGTEEVCQTPINFNDAEASCTGGDGRPEVNFGGPFKAAVTNNASWEATVKVGIPEASRTKVKIGSQEYGFEEFHFHVGVDHAKGSQHTLDGNYHQMELHISMVIVNGTSENVLAFFVDGNGATDNAAFDPLVKAMKELHKPGDVHEATLSLTDIVAPAISGEYYQYNGTSQLPPCHEIIPWTFYQTPLVISAEQLKAFYDIGITSAFREIKPLNGRNLFKSDKKC